jgi:chromate transporter
MAPCHVQKARQRVWASQRMEEITKDGRDRLWEIAKEFLRLGFVAFGGPPVHLAMMEERFVRRKRWVSRERFVDLLGARIYCRDQARRSWRFIWASCEAGFRDSFWRGLVLFCLQR